MSYARFGWGGSDVYVFVSIGGHIECCGCKLGDQWSFPNTDAMLVHLQEHRDAGHTVPQNCTDGLLAEKAENDDWLARINKLNVRQGGSIPYGKWHRFEEVICIGCKGSGWREVPPIKDGLFGDTRGYDGPCRMCLGDGKRMVGRDFEHFFTVLVYHPIRRPVVT